ncbi:Hypothetical predicted protein, partial [Paramuricea clavata]
MPGVTNKLKRQNEELTHEELTREELENNGVGIYPEREYACDQCRGVAIFDDHHGDICHLTPKEYSDYVERQEIPEEDYVENISRLEYWEYWKSKMNKDTDRVSEYATDGESEDNAGSVVNDDDDDIEDDEVETGSRRLRRLERKKEEEEEERKVEKFDQACGERKKWFYPNPEGLYYCDICGNDPDQVFEHAEDEF